MKGSIPYCLCLILCSVIEPGESLSQTTSASDSLRHQLGIGAVIVGGDSDGVGVSYNYAVSDHIKFRVRLEALFANSQSTTDQNFFVARAGCDYARQIRKVRFYAGADLFWGLYQSPLYSDVNQQQIGVYPLGGVLYQMFDRASIGVEAGPKFGYITKDNYGDDHRWTRNVVNDLFLYLSYRL